MREDHTGLEPRKPKRCSCHRKGASWKMKWRHGEGEVTLDRIFVEPAVNETYKYSVKEADPNSRFRIGTMHARLRCSACGKIVPKSRILPIDSPLAHPDKGEVIVDGFTSGSFGDHPF